MERNHYGVNIPRIGMLVRRMLAVGGAACALSLSLAAQSPNSKLLEDNLRNQFTATLKWIAAAEQVPKYARFRSELASFQDDAVRLFNEGAAICTRCIATNTHSGECDSAFLRQTTVEADSGALAAFTMPDQIRPEDDADTIRPQVERWVSHDFADSRARLLHYANTPGSWRSIIMRASGFTNKAAEAADVDDWSGAIIYLRHAQLLMETAVTQEMMKATPTGGPYF